MEQFKVNTMIYMGAYCLDKLKENTIKKACIICDPFMVESLKIDLIVQPLEEMKCEYEIFSEVVPDPTIQVVSKVVGKMHSFAPDTIIALGGGSAIDTAKAATHIYTQLGNEKPLFIAVPTTSGTGSEVTNFSVITDLQEQVKYPLRSDRMLPDVAFLDSRLTVSVPAHITADTGMDVLTHALEAYVSTRSCDFTDAYAEKAVRMVWKYLVKTVEKGDDIEARSHMHHASCLAGVAFNSASLGLCHSMAHALGAYFHIPHGRSNALLLPHIISYNAGLEETEEFEACYKYVELANMLGMGAGTNKATVHLLITQIKNMMSKIKIPQYITELKISKEEFEQAIEEMSKKALADQCTLTNPRKPKLEEIEAIYRRLYKGGCS